MHCRCIFHLHTQEWSSIPRKGIDHVERNCLILPKEWVDSWIFEIGREEHYKDSLKNFKEVVIKHTSQMKKTVPHMMTIVNSLENPIHTGQNATRRVLWIWNKQPHLQVNR